MSKNCLLIDIDKTIIKNNLNNLQRKIRGIPPGDPLSPDRGVVIIFPSSQLDILNGMKKGQERLKYINGASFITNILAMCVVLYKSGICEIYNLLQVGAYIPNVLDCLQNNLSPSIKLRISLNLNENGQNIVKLVQQGFAEPHICGSSLCLYRPNHTVNNVNIHTVMNIVKYTIEQYKIRDGNCSMIGTFSREAIDSLIKMPYNNNGKEVAGALKIVANKNIDNKTIHIMGLIKNTVVNGKKETVEVENVKYNFHSHPKEAYVKYNAKYAWPSYHDYTGFINAVWGAESIFHVVTTLEGIYIISIAPEWVGGVDKLKGEKKYIEETYDICPGSFQSPQEYISYVNGMPNGIFIVQYLTWDEVKRGGMFTVYFPKVGGNCYVE